MFGARDNMVITQAYPSSHLPEQRLTVLVDDDLQDNDLAQDRASFQGSPHTMMDQISSQFWKILKGHSSSRAPMRLAGAFVGGALSQLDFSFFLVLISFPPFHRRGFQRHPIINIQPTSLSLSICSPTSK